MLKKKQRKLIQHLEHSFELQDYNTFLEETAPLIGYIVQSFNSLEQSLNNAICKFLSDRSDEKGLLVLHNMPYSSKVDLFARFSKSLHTATETSQENLIELIKNLKESARLRNAVVHADWENTDYEGYTFVKIKSELDGLHQEYYQFTVAALNKIDKFLDKTEKELWAYEDEKDNIQYGNTQNNS